MTTDVHQQRLSKPRSGTRKCTSCGVSLYDSESAWADGKGGWTRVDRCIHCCVYGPPRRPEGSPPSAEFSRAVGGKAGDSP